MELKMKAVKKSDKKKIRTHRGLAILSLIVGAVSIFSQKYPASVFNACGFFLFAWTLFHYPSPSLSSTPSEIYRTARSGEWVTPKHVRVVSWLAFILLAAGTYFQYRS